MIVFLIVVSVLEAGGNVKFLLFSVAHNSTNLALERSIKYYTIEVFETETTLPKNTGAELSELSTFFLFSFE